MKNITAFTLICAISFGCATKPENIGASYVSPYKYKDYDEDQIIMEMDYLGQRVNELYFSLKRKQKMMRHKWALDYFYSGLLSLLLKVVMVRRRRVRKTKRRIQRLGNTVMKKISIHQLPPSPQKILDDMTTHLIKTSLHIKGKLCSPS